MNQDLHRVAEFEHWASSRKIGLGCTLLAMLGIGIYGYSPLIVDEWPRLDPWQKIAMWVADATAVLLVLKWIISEPDDRIRSAGEERLFPQSFSARWIAVALLTSLAMDISITVYGIYSERWASDRSLVTTARVAEVQKIHWNPVTHYRLRVEFLDQANQPHRGLLVFKKRTDGYPEWIRRNTREKLEQNQVGFPIEIRYDPMRPPRVWTRFEPWNRGDALGYIFAFIHIFQTIVVVGFSFAVLLPGRQLPDRNLRWGLPLIALAVQAAACLLIGIMYWWRGF